jgi:undecaprenyl diphosphate synthase
MDDTDRAVPKHVGYIVDGNRRWAKKYGLPAYEGHLAGHNALKEIAIETLKQGVEYISAYVFSTENWSRSSNEVKKLMGIVLKILTADLPEFHKHNVRLKVIGSLDERVQPRIIKAIAKAEEETAKNDGGTFVICFNYGGQLEITEAVKKIVQSGVSADEVTPDLIAENIYAPEVPPIDLIVRTSGEQRLSNFMLWRSAYSELLFLDKPWPDMTKDDVTAIMKEYTRRQRRFGG